MLVQEALLRAFRYFGTFTGGKWARLVPQDCSQYVLRLARPEASTHQPTSSTKRTTATVRPGFDPEAVLLHTDDVKLIERAMSHLPDRFREVLVLRELEGLSVPRGSWRDGHSHGHRHVQPLAARQAFRGAVNNQLKQSGMPTNAHPREPEADAVLV